MTDDTENIKNFDREDPKSVLEVLTEYHEQTVEDCRIIGNQKYSVLISLSIALGSFIYALAQVYYAVIGTSFNYTIVGTLKTFYTNTPSVLSLSGNTSSIQPVLSNIASIPLLTKIIILLLIIFILLFIAIVLTTIGTFIFLTAHLDLMTRISVKIEELQRDVLFKERTNVYLFSWNDIIKNEISRNESLLLFGIKKQTFKDYLKQKFILENITDIITNANNDHIQIDITDKKEKKSGTLSLDKEKKVAILNIDGVELDRFNVKEKNGDLILYESELKYRFRNVMPHSTVLKPSYAMNIKLIYRMTAVFLISEAFLILLLYLLSR